MERFTVLLTPEQLAGNEPPRFHLDKNKRQNENQPPKSKREKSSASSAQTVAESPAQKRRTNPLQDKKCKRGEAYANAGTHASDANADHQRADGLSGFPGRQCENGGEIEKDKLREVSQALAHVRINTRIRAGEVVAKNICGTE